MKPSEILRVAIDEHLWNGRGDRPRDKPEYLCMAISRVVLERWDKPGYGKVSASARRVKDYIREQLDGVSSFETWLYREHDIPCWNNMLKLQATRKAWAEDMIKRYEALGL